MIKYKINYYCTVVSDVEKSAMQIAIIDKCIDMVKGKPICADVLADLLIELDKNRVIVKTINFIDREIFIWIE